MIEVAKKNFQAKPNIEYRLSDALKFTKNEKCPQKFNKSVCYSSFHYFTDEVAEKILKNLYDRFTKLETMFIGNLPDRELADKFFYEHIDYSKLLDDNTAPLGKWHSQSGLLDIISRTGWQAEILKMPEGFYAAHYRFDVKLTRD